MKMAVFWIVAPYNLVDVYRHVALMVEAAGTSETSANFYQITRRNSREDSHLSFQFLDFSLGRKVSCTLCAEER
jgi:hypothetical protein